MIFTISRASDWRKNKSSPCKKAFKENNQWFIEFDTLEELINFTKEEGEIIMDSSQITIYDDYVE